ncbi:hypothetical protein D9758_013222 [Tetrapyrgos nigripes]|uniref:Rho-GAP domain-containing protein n=1 Tax=Tetrapyrgos nigripes TaxID=182062 RepID=A0A8H5CU30_9AGAR|nr:hypothetical protein D9758_013222 [Tetrapyrgos nigripes]
MPKSSESKKSQSFFTLPWMKKNESGSIPSWRWMARTIFQAGVDLSEGRVLTVYRVVMNASPMPSPDEVNCGLLLSLCAERQKLTLLFVLAIEANYTIVFFAAGVRYTLGWNWVWKAYRSLNRKYRKSLKEIARAIISHKFFRYLDTLSELAIRVPLTQIAIPSARRVSRKPPKRIQNHHFHHSLLRFLVGRYHGLRKQKGPVPRVVRDCIQYLPESGLNDEATTKASFIVRLLFDSYDRGQVVSLEIWEEAGGGPHLAAVLLKKYLRDLPEPVFGEDMYAIIRKRPMLTSDPGHVEAVRLPELKPCVYILLSHYLHLMHEVHLCSASNRMDAHNLAVVLSPNLVTGTNPIRDVQMCLIPRVGGTGPTPGVPRSPLGSSSPLPSPRPSSPGFNYPGAGYRYGPGPSSPISPPGAGGFAQRYRNPFSPTPPTPTRATSSSSGLLSLAVPTFPNYNASNFPANPLSPTFVPSINHYWHKYNDDEHESSQHSSINRKQDDVGDDYQVVYTEVL